MVFSKDFVFRTFKGELGYCDEDLFNQALVEFQKRQDKPFFATLLTLSYHRSWRIPSGKIVPEPASNRYHEEIDAIRYTDWAINHFIEQACKTPYFKDTIFVFAADHMGGFKENPVTAASYRVPFLIYAPHIVQPARISNICSQLDIAPTIMHLLGGSYEHCFFGSTVLNRQADTGFAWILNGQQLIFINGRRQGVVLSPDDHQSFFTFSAPNTLTPLDAQSADAELNQMPVSILQIATEVFKNNTYNLSDSQSKTVTTHKF
jgi:phosphoglycerol transferase MdoB-like AlkP superfamily enzyme